MAKSNLNLGEYPNKVPCLITVGQKDLEDIFKIFKFRHTISFRIICKGI